MRQINSSLGGCSILTSNDFDFLKYVFGGFDVGGVHR